MATRTAMSIRKSTNKSTTGAAAKSTTKSAAGATAKTAERKVAKPASASAARPARPATAKPASPTKPATSSQTARKSATVPATAQPQVVQGSAPPREWLATAAYFLAEHAGGRGTLLGGVPGVLPGCVTILGGGTCGFNAAKLATGIGADTTILELDSERMTWLDMALPGVKTLYSTEAALAEILPRTDLLVGAVLVPGALAPRLVTRDLLRTMRNGTVFVDIAVDQGGCSETSRPTTHEDPIYVEEGVTHYCVSNMPGAYARTSTQALTSVTLPYVQAVALGGVVGAVALHPELRSGINCERGRLTCEEVAAAHGLDWEEPAVQ